MKQILSIGFLLPFLSFGQSHSLKHNLIGSASGNGQYLNNKEFYYSIGEPLINTIFTSQKVYTQGFIQPPENTISYSLEVFPTSCPEATDGYFSISNIEGCLGPVIITLDNEVYTNNTVGSLEAGIYEAQFEGTNCTFSMIIEISEGTGSCALNFHNAFSPNGDGDNETWVIGNIAVEEFANNSVVIYNRYGVIVWKGDNYNNETVVFEGKDLNGNELVGGTYFYTCSAANKVHTGFIELLK